MKQRSTFLRQRKKAGEAPTWLKFRESIFIIRAKKIIPFLFPRSSARSPSTHLSCATRGAAAGTRGSSSAEGTYLPLLLGAGELVGGCGGHCNPACPHRWDGTGWDGLEVLGRWVAPVPHGLFAAPLLLRCIYNPELACERGLSLAGLLFPHEGSSPEVCGHQSKLTGHCFFSMTTPAPPNGDRCPASDAGLWRALLLGKKGRKMGAL